MSESPEHGDNPAVDHEHSDVNVGAILRYGAALAVVALVAQVFLWWLQGFLTVAPDARKGTAVFPMAVSEQDKLPPQPRLQDRPQEELRDLRARQQLRLNGYGWVNKEAGIARIPIEEAMKAVVQQGLPTRNHEDAKARK